ncbi:MAG: N-acetyl sugar amidotransferase [Proteobacteria bacterium]|nr:N-acetyl sugar amidotransferase [Pseudomonadota bacterium]MBU1738772.1 N-acetyl sugar amidotransferase [Pseudomonadota bacterium]
MKRCSNCCLPETQDSIRFDENGVCTVCNQIKVKKEKIDWDQRKEWLLKLCERFRGKHGYDCIVPFSGGKDSTYTLWYLVTQLKLKPLVISFDHGFYRPQHLENRERTLKKLHCDFVSFKASWKIVRELMLESLRRKGDFCWHCHCGVYAGSMRMAVEKKIPLIFWGQPDAEYGSYGYSYEEIQEVNERQFNRFVNLGITAEDMVGMLPEWVELRDLEMFRYPKLEEIQKLGIVSVHLGSFIPWDPRKMGGVIRDELGWKWNTVEGIPEEYGWEKVECMFTGIRDYLKYIKRGFGRTTHLVSIDIREGRKNREEAMELIDEFDGKRPASLDLFLELTGINENEFMEIAMSHEVVPYKHDPTKKLPAEPLGDQHLWRNLLGIDRQSA